MHKHQYGVCPVCDGTGRVPANPDQRRDWRYDSDTDTTMCQNCGGQTMSLKPTGRVRLRPDGTPCHHEYVRHQAGRCYVEYVCNHCGDSFGIDSSG